MEDYIDLNNAKLLKIRGFDWAHANCFIDEGGIMKYPKPTVQMVLKWLLDVHHLFIEVNICLDNSLYYINGIYRVMKNEFAIVYEMNEDETIFYKTPETGIKKAINYCLNYLV